VPGLVLELVLGLALEPEPVLVLEREPALVLEREPVLVLALGLGLVPHRQPPGSQSLPVLVL